MTPSHQLVVVLVKPPLDLSECLSIVSKAVGNASTLEGHWVEAAVMEAFVEVHLKLPKLKLYVESGFPEWLFTCLLTNVVVLKDTLQVFSRPPHEHFSSVFPFTCH